MHKNIVVIGSSGALGSAFTQTLSQTYPDSIIHAFSRKVNSINSENIRNHFIDYSNEESIAKAAHISAMELPLDIVIVATGILHDNSIMPEKSLKELSAEKFHHLFTINTIVPALLAKYFLPKLNRNQLSIFAALSARIGSISDNNLGGWYAYRASKAALNMIIKNAAIETTRVNPNAIIVGLHPGTVDSSLSKPFQNHIPDNQLFSPEYSVQKLLHVIDNLSANQSGKCFAWDGSEVLP